MYDPLRAKAKIVLWSGAAFLMGLGMASGLGWTSSSMAMPTIDVQPQVEREAVQPALDLSQAFVNVSGVVTPAVVRIESRRTVTAAQQQEQMPEAFRRFFDAPEGGAPQQRLSGGSGFIVSSDGYILTNDHVVAGSDQVRVYLPDRRYFNARVVGTDPYTDVAVIKVDVDEALPTLSLGSSDEVRVGEWVLAIGNPGFGSGGGDQLDYTVTAGIVSARGRSLDLIRRELQRDGIGNDLTGFAIEDYIQTDAVINPGNSGGPMVDLQGRVVGINSAIASATGFYQGYGFAIPIDLARRIMEDLIEYGHVRRPQLGVSIEEVFAEDAEAFGLPSVSGVLVQTVAEGGPADAAGMEQGDVIVSIEGERIGYVSQLQGEVAMYRPGDRIDVTVYRDGEPRTLTVRLGEAPISEAAPVVADAEVEAANRLGIQVQELDPELAEQIGYSPTTQGVVITQVAPASAAARRQLPRGWRIVEINDRAIETSEDVREVLGTAEPGSVVQFIVEDPTGSSRIVNVRMPGA